MLEPPKFRRTADELSTALDAWLYFLRHAEQLDTEGLPAPLRVPEIERAMEVLLMVTQSDLERERYEARVKLQRDERSRLSSARREGLQLGELVGRIHAWQELLGRPLTPADELASLTVEDLKRLADELRQELGH
jgi:predicted transposase/invertase (TIGR01784 family)